MRVKMYKDFEIGKCLGAGSFGRVYKAMKTSENKSYALKLIFDYEEKYEKSKNEIEKLITINNTHPNIVNYMRSWVDDLNEDLVRLFGESIFSDSDDVEPTRKVLFIQMELCTMDLRKWLKLRESFDEKISKGIFIHILNGLRYIHIKNIIHRDLKPDNILLLIGPSLVAKIGDFGLAAFQSTKRIKNNCHSEMYGKLYRPPEQETGEYGYKVDIFPIGLVLFELFYLEAKNDLEYILRNLRNKIFPENFKCQDTNIKDIISSLVDFNPENRYEIHQILSKMGESTFEASMGRNFPARIAYLFSIAIKNISSTKEKENFEREFWKKAFEMIDGNDATKSTWIDFKNEFDRIESLIFSFGGLSRVRFAESEKFPSLNWANISDLRIDQRNTLFIRYMVAIDKLPKLMQNIDRSSNYFDFDCLKMLMDNVIECYSTYFTTVELSNSKYIVVKKIIIAWKKMKEKIFK